VRQPWEYVYCTGVPAVASNNEPIGPGASVATEDSPIRLLAGAITTHVANIPMYVFHSRAGVRGDVDIATMPGIDAFRFMDRYVPGDLASWDRQNHHWAGSPFRVFAIEGNGNMHADAMWPDFGQSASGCVRAYSGVNGNRFFTFPIGIKSRVVMEAKRNCEFDVIDPMTGNVVRHEVLNAGQRFELSGGEAFVLSGNFR
jgi:hypothetical protein